MSFFVEYFCLKFFFDISNFFLFSLSFLKCVTISLLDHLLANRVMRQNLLLILNSQYHMIQGMTALNQQEIVTHKRRNHLKDRQPREILFAH